MYQKFTSTEIVAQSCSTMEAETILKNGMNLKSLINRRNFLNFGILNTVFRTVLLTVLMLGSIISVMATNYGQISFSTTYSSQINGDNNSDRYTVVLPVAGTLSVNLSTNGGSGALPNYAVDVQWLNAGGTPLGGSPNGGFIFPWISGNIVLGAGTYHIEVIQRSGNPGYTGNYNIRVDCFVDEIEPNNTTATAQLLPFGYTVRGEITSTDNIDYFKFVLTQPGRLTVNVNLGSSSTGGLYDAYVYWYWYNTTETLINSSNPVGSYSSSMDLEAGTYYIRITPYGSRTGKYELRGDFVAAGNNEIEPNNTFATAQSLTFGQTVKGFISYQDNVDYYKYVLTQPGRFTVNVNLGNSSTGGLIDAYVSWYWHNTTETLIKSSNPVGSYNDYMDLEAGTYYIRITPYGSRTGTYELYGNFTAAGNNEIEPNQTRAEAQLLASGQTVKGFISYQDNIDMYRYFLAQPGILVVNVTRENTYGLQDMWVRWLDANGTQIRKDNYYTGSYNQSMNFEVAGNYFIEITPYSSNGTGTYNLTIQEKNTIVITSTGLTSLKVGQAVSGASIIYTISEGTYASSITASHFAVSNLPPGLNAGTAQRTSNTVVTVPITGAPTTYNASTRIITLPTSIPAVNVTGATSPITPSGTVVASAVAMGDGAAVSGAPTVSGTPTYNSITVNIVTIPTNPGNQSVEYAISTSTTTPTSGWQSSRTFNSLSSCTSYYFFARSAATSNYNAGTAQRSAAITTPSACSITVTSTGLTNLKVGQTVSSASIVFTTNCEFASTITASHFAVSNLPPGLTAGTATRTSNTIVTVPITGTPTTYSASTRIITLPTSISATNVTSSLCAITPTGTVTASAVAMGDGAAVSGAPTVSGTPTQNSITVNIVTIPTNPGSQTVEYAISTSTATPSSGWQSSRTFNSLSANTTYYVYARSAANTNYNAGVAQRSEGITTAPVPSIAITSTGLTNLQVGQLVNDASVVYTLADGIYTYASSITASNFAISNLPPGLTAGTATRTSNTVVTVSITGTPTTYNANTRTITLPTSIPASNVTGAINAITPTGTVTASAIAKGNGAAVSGAPTTQSKTTDCITVNSVTIPVNNSDNQTVQYAISTSTSTPANGWQSTTTFCGLNSNTAYYVFARSAESTNYNAGTAQRSLEITTDIIVTWYADGGIPIPTQTSVNHGGTINAPAEMTKTGYTFGGWFSDAGFTIPVTFPITNVITATTLYAKWTINSYSVTWYADGGTPIPTQTTVTHGGSITAPAEMTKTGYTFGGWFSDAGFTIPVTFPITNVTTATTLYAKWTINSYSVTWYADGGTPIPTQTTVTHGGSITAPEAMTKTGYTFGGWFSDAGFTIPVTFPITNVTTATTLYAKWTINSYSVTWYADGGTPIPTQTTVTHGGSITAPAEMTKTGYTFGGWFSDAGFTIPVTFPITNVTAATTLYAKWTINSYSVTWYADGGTPVPTQTTVTHGGSITAPAEMTKTGYTFGDWFSDAGFTIAVSFPITNVTTATTLYAKWTINTYSVTWYADGGIPIPTQTTVNHGGTITAPAEMTKTGYTYGGWFSDASFTTLVSFPITNVTAATTLYAKWTINTYPVTWYADGGTPIPTQTTVEHGGTITAPAEMTKTGYTYEGWFSDAVFTTLVTFPIINITEATTLYAKWTEDVSVLENEMSNINVYPNPTIGELKIESGQLTIDEIVIFDSYGRNLLFHKFLMTSEATIDISKLSAGIYFVKIRTEKGEVVRKIVKE